jgi:hypothetical protein
LVAVGWVVEVVLLCPPVDCDVVASDVVVSGAVVVAGSVVTGAGVLVDVGVDSGAGAVVTGCSSCTTVLPPPAAPVTAGRLRAPPVEGTPVA